MANRSEAEGMSSNEEIYGIEVNALNKLKAIDIRQEGVSALQDFLNEYSADPTGETDSLRTDGILNVRTKEWLRYFLEQNPAVDNPENAYNNIMNQLLNVSKERNIMDTLKQLDKDLLK
tara:strand:- start:293 stop:649 length:357 start_codon:yes stop_codon:yes gene_type:complete